MDQIDASYLLYLTKPDTAKGFIFGLRIPFLPDFLLDHTLLGQEPSDRIQEFCRRWTTFVSGLWRSEGDVTYSLRFDLHQPNKRIESYLLGRLSCSNGLQEQEQAILLLKDMARMLKSEGFEPEKLNQAELETLSQNFRYPYVFEVCQEEVRTPIRQDTPITGDPNNSETESEFSIPQPFIYPELPKQLYGIRPWWGPGGTFLGVFNAIAAQNVSMSICVLLTPTQLTPEERTLLADIARQAESLAQIQTRGTNFGNAQLRPSQNKTDPQLRWESRLYAANLRRLNHPFLATVFCFAEDHSAAQQVASALASTLREEQGYELPLGESEAIASGAKVIPYPNSSYLPIICQKLDFRPLMVDFHKKDAPNKALQRLRYLMDGRGAASVFRFPISVEGGVPGIAVKQRPPDFHPGPRNEQIPPDHIDLGRFHVGGRATLSKDAFTKHALITGFTGSGKSNTSLYLLDQFWRKFQIPFLVIESAKKEYRGLRKVDVFENQLRVYTLGDETVSPLRFNPFELMTGVRVEAHIAKLQTCFEGALPHVGPLPSVIAEGLEVIYRQKGWQLTDKGRSQGEVRQFPTMQDFYIAVEKVLTERGYQGETKSNMEAAIKGRIKPLLMGSKGMMFNCSVSSPSAGELFTHPVILELNDLNEQDKSFLVMFFLTLLREYRELHPSKQLTHITLVEEAHNVLENVASKGSEEGGTSDVKAKAVQSFCNMLAEVRAYGEGLIIADQSPEKLARDAMRNTNVQIAHQLRDAYDREAIANAMIMSEEQQDFLGKCETGRAAIFYTGLQKATFVDVPVYKDPTPPSYESKSSIENVYRGFEEWLSPQVSDEEVRVYMLQFGGVKNEELSCSLCENSCQYRDDILILAEASKEQFQEAYKRFKTAKSKGEPMKNLARLILKITNVKEEKNFDLAWCYTQEVARRCGITGINQNRKSMFIKNFKGVIDSL